MDSGNALKFNFWILSRESCARIPFNRIPAARIPATRILVPEAMCVIRNRAGSRGEHRHRFVMQSIYRRYDNVIRQAISDVAIIILLFRVSLCDQQSRFQADRQFFVTNCNFPLFCSLELD